MHFNFKGLYNHFLQILSHIVPGGSTHRVKLHKWRGVDINEPIWIGQRAIIETAYPDRIHIDKNSAIGIGCLLIAHQGTSKEPKSLHIRIKENVFIGPNSVVLPGVTIGEGAVVAAGSVVNRNVEPYTFVQGNPAKAIARVGKPIGMHGNFDVFSRSLRKIKKQDDAQANH